MYKQFRFKADLPLSIMAVAGAWAVAIGLSLVSTAHAQSTAAPGTPAASGKLAKPAPPTTTPNGFVFGDPTKYITATDEALQTAAKHRPPPYVFNVDRKTDATLRAVLSRWVTAAGWTHEPEHWTVANDYPVSGSADLGTDFKGAVRRLLTATSQTDRPVKPCFYGNSILRVVPRAQLCDATANVKSMSPEPEAAPAASGSATQAPVTVNSAPAVDALPAVDAPAPAAQSSAQ
jgi:Toxin co-regulated pilus biosynthesis protein Q